MPVGGGSAEASISFEVIASQQETRGALSVGNSSGSGLKEGQARRPAL